MNHCQNPLNGYSPQQATHCIRQHAEALKTFIKQTDTSTFPMTKTKHLTKSIFKLACECPTKLFYTGKSEYADHNQVDKFLKALAEGGIQVGELAKRYFPSGFDIKMPGYEQSLAETNELLNDDKVIIYEAAIQAGNLFIRADILVKDGNKLELYEVKAKSFDLNEVNPFRKANGAIDPKWKPYLSDVAFQKHVLQLAFPDYEISTHLMLVDKNAKCPTDGLHQKFKLVKISKNKIEVEMTETLTEEELDSPILCKVNVDKECESIFNSVEDVGSNKSMSFKDRVDLFAEHYASDTKISMPISTRCHSCEFYTTDSDSQSKLSGKKECWKEQLGWNDEDFNEQTVLDVWNFRKKDELIQEGRIKMSALTKEDVNPTPDDQAGYSRAQRQWLQIEKSQNNDEEFWIDYDGLQKAMDSWVFPLHFIDFETTAVAIPFNAGRKPYEGIAFQFSHHILYKNGAIEHAGQYLNSDRGVFPNYEFLRKLKAELEHDSGTIFRYSYHENTYLKTIYDQLQEDITVSDREELCQFIKTITESKKEDDEWIGKRNMVDLCEIVKRHFYDPRTNGSNSIKAVLPAILNSSKLLKDKYSKPIYGASNGIKSLNYNDFSWVEFENGKVKDPYKLLPKLFEDSSDEDESKLYFDDELNHGGAAMTAYARMQFADMSESECNEIRNALLKYCELDTMAMVMIYEGLIDLLSKE
jgi:hypothetical protein